ncbi:Nucleoside-diphosphate-sugar epimerase [Filimonas lacunae]|uniref:Nucleoside-diphosphate-sugar epimerase n=1 Tax=Filimonas lacunae TaxID=477680 RepID=A0A173MRT6_9BACT|nr:NAD-dependent epimerase/dehydratase family protein [Filimonas lacunae]BAV10207.1 UDP-glucose 6-epimerase [Filimonas lacunae]SIT18259.1 Nucleoside-diphosphate-sugar epimerase [Filimonas lacunae]
MNNILLTGASGFLGKHMLNRWCGEGMHVDSLGRADSNSIRLDIVNEFTGLQGDSFDVVVHAAGKAHSIPKEQWEEEQFFDVNLQGTIHLCRALEKGGKLPYAFVFISTVAVYGISEGNFISEDVALNGSTPYALSKIAAEEYLISWCKDNDITLVILRPPLIAGANAPGNLGAMVQAIDGNRYFRIGKGEARKSIVMAEDIAAVIPDLVKVGGIYNITDDDHPSFKELEEVIARQLNKRIRTMPLLPIRIASMVGDLLGPVAPINSEKLNKIIKTLTFSNQKIKQAINWKPTSVLNNYKII